MPSATGWAAINTRGTAAIDANRAVRVRLRRMLILLLATELGGKRSGRTYNIRSHFRKFQTLWDRAPGAYGGCCGLTIDATTELMRTVAITNNELWIGISYTLPTSILTPTKVSTIARPSLR